MPEELVLREREFPSPLHLRQEEVRRGAGDCLSLLLTELAQAREQLRPLWTELGRISPEYVTLRRGEPSSWRALQEDLRHE